MLTLADLVGECDLQFACGAEHADRAVRWVHISELEDPTPWLSGGELLLTTGIQLSTPARQARFATRLAEHNLAGLGLGTGFTHSRIPKALQTACEEAELPLFEVPYETPFIAITERAFSRLLHEQYDVLYRDARVHERLEQLVVEGRGLEEIMRTIADAAGGIAVLQDAAGTELAIASRGTPPSGRTLEELGREVSARGEEADRSSFEPEAGDLGGRALSIPVPGRAGAAPVGWLTVAGERHPLDDFERLVARRAAMIVGLELMRERVVQETERRLAGNVLAEALSGNLGAEELAGRLRPFGVGEVLAVLLFAVEDPHAAETRLEAALAAAGVPSLVASTKVGEQDLLCAVIDAADREPVEVAVGARRALGGARGGLRVSASRAMGAGAVRRAFHEARCALEAAVLRNGDAPEVASHEDLGAYTLLLSLQDDDALRAYSDGLLEPIAGVEGQYGGELLRSLEVFIENNGNWERAARQLYCHRHTLRYRIRKIEELTGRDLARATDRIELWLALRARELVR
jgi:DNA-binding PucR family transcriptional regulator